METRIPLEDPEFRYYFGTTFKLLRKKIYIRLKLGSNELAMLGWPVRDGICGNPKYTVFYKGQAVDEFGNIFSVKWYPFDDWQDRLEENNDEKSICDWNHPVDIEFIKNVKDQESDPDPDPHEIFLGK